MPVSPNAGASGTPPEGPLDRPSLRAHGRDRGIYRSGRPKGRRTPRGSPHRPRRGPCRSSRCECFLLVRPLGGAATHLRRSVRWRGPQRRAPTAPFHPRSGGTRAKVVSSPVPSRRRMLRLVSHSAATANRGFRSPWAGCRSARSSRPTTESTRLARNGRSPDPTIYSASTGSRVSTVFAMRLAK